MKKLLRKKHRVSKSIEDLVDFLRQEIAARGINGIQSGYTLSIHNRDYEITIACKNVAIGFLFLLPNQLELKKNISLKLYWKKSGAPRRYITTKISIPESKFFSDEFFNSLCKIINLPYSENVRKKFQLLR